MPAKKSFTRDMLIDSAFKLVRAKGIDKLSARTLAKVLNCSTQPIYSNFKSMDKLDMELRKRAIEVLVTYQKTPKTGQVIYDVGLGYVLFARKETNLFRFLFGENKRGKAGGYGRTLRKSVFQELIQVMKSDPIFQGLDEEQLDGVITKMWIVVHGISFLMMVNAFAEKNSNYLETMLKETVLYIIEGEKAKRNIA